MKLESKTGRAPLRQFTMRSRTAEYIGNVFRLITTIISKLKRLPRFDWNQIARPIDTGRTGTDCQTGYKAMFECRRKQWGRTILRLSSHVVGVQVLQALLQAGWELLAGEVYTPIGLRIYRYFKSRRHIRNPNCGFRGKVLCHRMVVLPTAFDTGYESQKAGSNENLQVQNVF